MAKAETYRIEIEITGRDRASGALKGLAGALGSVGKIAAGILAADLLRRVAQGVANMAREAFGAVAQFERMGHALKALTAREFLALNAAENFARWMRENLDATDAQVERYLKLRQEYERLRDVLQQMRDAGQTDTEYYRRMSAYYEEVRQQIAAVIPGFRSLDATLRRAAYGGMNMSDALRAAVQPSKELLRWAVQLAIYSPFSSEGVINALKTAIAYGFTVKEAKKLTEVMIDFTSATGAGEDAMWRIALALGQIRAKGRLMGQEILQLVNAGVPVNDILREMGYSLEDVRKGLVDAETFMRGFTEYMERNFGGAARRQTEIWQGLANALGDIRELGLKAVFEDMLTALKPLVVQFMEWMQDEGLAKLERLGDILGDLTETIIALASGDWDTVMLGLKRLFGLDIRTAAQIVYRLRRIVEGAKTLKAIITETDWRVVWQGLVARAQAELQRLRQAIDKKLQPLRNIAARIWKALEPVRRWFQALWQVMDFSGLIQRVRQFVGDIASTFDDFRDAFAETVNYLTQVILPPIVDSLRGLWEDMQPVLQMVADGIRAIAAVIVGLLMAGQAAVAAWFGTLSRMTQATLGAIGRFWRQHGDTILAYLSFVFQTIITIVSVAFQAIVGILRLFLTAFSGTMRFFLAVLRGDWEGAWQILRDTFRHTWEIIRETAMNIAETLLGYWQAWLARGYERFRTGFQRIAKAVVEKLTTMKEQAVQKVQALLDWLRGLPAEWMRIGVEWIKGLAGGVLGKLEELKQKVAGLVSSIVAKVQEVTGIHSPSRVFAEIGRQWMEGLAQGISMHSYAPARATMAATGAAIAAPSYTWNLSFGFQGMQMTEDDIVRAVQAARFLAGA